MLRFVTALLAILAGVLPGCEPISPNISATPTSIVNVEMEAARVETVDLARTLTYRTDTLNIALTKPAGWMGETTDGIIMAEHMTAMNTGEAVAGILLYIFVPPLDRFALPTDTDANVAHTILAQVLEMPHEIGQDTMASEPIAFLWDGYQAAYYLLTSDHGTHTIVLGLSIREAGSQYLVVINASVPAVQEAHLRSTLPTLLDGLQVGGQTFSGAALAALPDPLGFPTFDIAHEGGDFSVQIVP